MCIVLLCRGFHFLFYYWNPANASLDKTNVSYTLHIVMQGLHSFSPANKGNLLGYREKNAWICGLSILVVYTPYFYFVLRFPMSHVAFFFIAVLSLVLLLSCFHAINVIATKSIRDSGNFPKLDELDKVIELRASKWAGVVLSVAVLFWSLAAMMGVPIEEISNIAGQQQTEASVNESDFSIPVTKAMFWIHLLFGGFVLSNLVYYGKIIAGYRRLQNG